MNKRHFFQTILLSSVTGGIAAFGLFHYLSPHTYTSNDGIEAKQLRFANYSGVQDMNETGFTKAAEISTPAVVHIRTYKEQQVQYYQHPFDDIFREFFGNQYQPQQPQQQGPVKSGTGSGVILTPDGYIATNNHVVAGADKIEVVLNDKRRYTAELIGTDPSTDLALLRIKEDNLPYVKYGNSDVLKIGEWVLAVGNPFELTSTVTAGIVSAKARSINILKDKDNLAIESFIQTDAAVNPGNSGGALVNLNGELVGINSAIATPTGTFAGYSFAIPVTLVKKVMNDLLKFGHVQRALLGVSFAEITAELAEQKGIKDIKGVYISEAREGGAAADAGLKEGDIILKVNETDVNSASELQEVIGRHQPGDKVKVTYLRDGKSNTLDVTLKNKMGSTAIVKKDEESALVNVLGAELQKITDKEKTALKIQHGVKVTKLSNGKLRQAGIGEGFIITSVDKKKVESPTDVVDLINANKGGILLEGVYPSGKRAYYAIGW